MFNSSVYIYAGASRRRRRRAVGRRSPDRHRRLTVTNINGYSRRHVKIYRHGDISVSIYVIVDLIAVIAELRIH